MPCRSFRSSWIVLVVLLIASGCAASRDAEDRDDIREPTADVEVPGQPALSGKAANVATVQLYPEGQELRIPVLGGNVEQLTLRFDLLSDRSRPLSVYFYHADRNWRRDLTPSQYLRNFHRDDVLEYQPSEGTEVSYYHYVYEFPNDAIQFDISGNYILRVTEQGMEDEVLFERPFFVAEQTIPAQLTTDYVLAGGGGFSATQPFLLFTPPSLDASSPNDFSTCFVRNGRFDSARCSTRPSLIESPAIQFYLPSDASFEAEPGDYYLDLSALQVGSQIERIDFSATPFNVLLAPDYARFAGSDIGPLQFGQPAIQSVVRDQNNPSVGGEYVDVTFSFVPPNEFPLSQDVHVTGAFNNWMTSSANRMSWNAGEGRYEATLRVKQGTYEYRYSSRDRQLHEIMSESPPRAENAYQAFIYYDDITAGTQRLLSVTGVMAR